MWSVGLVWVLPSGSRFLASSPAKSSPAPHTLSHSSWFPPQHTPVAAGLHTGLFQVPNPAPGTKSATRGMCRRGCGRSPAAR